MQGGVQENVIDREQRKRVGKMRNAHPGPQTLIGVNENLTAQSMQVCDRLVIPPIFTLSPKHF
jgi:hypothetical protein